MKRIAGVFLLSLALALPLSARAQLNVNINIALPPPLLIAEPPRMVVLPETYVYVAPELDIDIFFYDGWWWRGWEGRWYRSRSYSSGWIYYEDEPVFYRNVPREWRRWYRERRWREDYTWDHRPIPFHEVEQNWQDWEDRRYWERENTWYVPGLRSSTHVEVEVHATSPPPIMFAREPELIVIPETYVYVVPNLEIDVFFYDGWWWQTWEGRWYRSHSHRSDWVYYRNVPAFFRDIPRDWRRSYRDHRWRENHWDYRPLPYHQVERNWRDWQDRRYWEKQKKWDMRPRTAKSPPAPVYYKTVGPSQPQHYRGPEPYYNKGGKPQHNKQPKGNPHKGKGNKHD